MEGLWTGYVRGTEPVYYKINTMQRRCESLDVNAAGVPIFIGPLHRFMYVELTNDVSFACVCPVINHEFRHNIVKVAVESADYFDNVMTKIIINNRTAARKTDVNLLILQ